MLNDLQRPLDGQELDVLELALAGFPQAMNIEMLDGFFAALASSPDVLAPSEYLATVLGTDDPVFATPEQDQNFHTLLSRFWNTVVRSLQSGEPYDPILIEYDGKTPTANDWAIGFMQGVQIGGEAWAELFKDEEHDQLIAPMLVLVYEHDPDPDLRPIPITAQMREQLLAGIAAFMPEIYTYFAKYRRGGVGMS